MVAKQRIEVWIDYDDYKELQGRDRSISDSIRAALQEYLGKAEIKTEQLQKAMEKMQQTIILQSEHIENLEKEAEILKGKGEFYSSPLPFEV